MTAQTKPLLVRDVMTRKPICVDLGTTLRELAQTLAGNDISGVPVVGSDGRLVGVASKTDVVRRCTEGEFEQPVGYVFELLSAELGSESDLLAEPPIVVDDFMSTEPVTAGPDEPVAAVARRMADERVHRVVVVDAERRPIGIVTSLDLLRVFPA